MARGMVDNQVMLEIPTVAKYGPVSHSKALKTGGKTDPDKFVLMFESIMDKCIYEWDLWIPTEGDERNLA